MKTRRAFIFSIDSFVAFSLALLALYSLVFFSAIPYTYYSSLMQAHNLAKDSLYTLSVAPSPYPASAPDTVLGDIVLLDNREMAEEYLENNLIPEEFGYILDKKVDDDWETISSTLDDKYFYKKLKTVSYGLVIDYLSSPDSDNPYGYNTCDGSAMPCSTDSSYDSGDLRVILVRLTVYA